MTWQYCAMSSTNKGKATMKNVAIYSRVSRDEQAKGYSLPTQLEACRKFAAEHGYTVIAEFAEDHTGAELDRPELDRARELAKRGAITGLIVYELDRFARKLVHQIIVEEEFLQSGVSVEYALYKFADTPEGRFQKQIHAAVAELEREKIRERTMRGKVGRAKEGYIVVGGTSRYGYCYKADPEGHKGWYEVVEAEAQVVRWIYDWYVMGDEHGKKLGTVAIARRLTELGIPTRCDGATSRKRHSAAGVWARSTIAKILEGELYTGVFYFNQTRSVPYETADRDRVRKARSVKRDRDEWVKVEVPAIIGRELWELAQQQKVVNRVNSVRNTRHDYLMRSRLTCHVCGSVFCAQTDNRSGTHKQYYFCRGQRRRDAPDGKTLACTGLLRADHWDRLVWAFVEDLLRDPKRVLTGLRQKQAEAIEATQPNRDRLAIVERNIKKLTDKRAELLDKYLEHDVDRDEYLTKKANLTDEIERFSLEATALQRKIADVELTDSAIRDVMAYCRKARKGLKHFTLEDRRSVIEALDITGIVVRGATRKDDKIVLTGIFTAELQAEGHTYLQTCNQGCTDTNTAGIPFSHVLTYEVA